MQNSVICTTKTSLYGLQPSSVVLCMQNSDFRSRLTSLYGYQTSTVVLNTHNSMFSTRISRLYVFQPTPAVLCMQMETLGLQLHVTVSPRPHLWFLHVKQRHLNENNESQCVPDLTCRFVHAKQHDLLQN